MPAQATDTANKLRVTFFEYLFGESEGYLCIATSHKVRAKFKQFYYEWPKQAPELATFLDLKTKDHNVWFCVNLLSVSERLKINCLPGGLVWADLDYVDPTKINPPPSCILESSPKRYQAFWRLENDVPPDVAESFSKKIAYSTGADRSGWPLGKLLRVPHTRNFKYENPPEVSVTSALETRVPVAVFDELPETTPENVPEGWEAIDAEMPDSEHLPNVQNILYAYRGELSKTEAFINLFSSEPPENTDWSALLWRFINVCFEAGMDKEEVFALAIEAKCNKYARDNRPLSHLWKEVVKASANHSKIALVKDTLYSELKMPRIIDEDGFEEDSFVVDYKKWGVAATDAPEQYHELACFVALSSLVSSGLRLELDWGELVPNLWGLILGESTLTRKTTVMKMAVELIRDLDEEIVLATDGSAEGLLTGLADRPARVSMFYKDEVSGFFDSINRKDYLAGMPETLTQLYDVPPFMQRLLRKETITITKPYFIFFGGGIRDKVYSLIDEEYILSGFLPRFLVVSGENDLSRVRRTGPPGADTTNFKRKVASTFGELKVNYNIQAPVEIGTGGQSMMMPVRVDAKLTDKAWEYYGDLEMLLVTKATESAVPMVALPTFQRLAFSMLKMSLLIAITRREPKDNRTIVVEKSDVEQAAYYIQKWGHYTVDLVANAGKPQIEKLLDKITLFVSTNPGCTKSSIMLRYRLGSREMKEVLATLLDRGVINISQKGRTTKLFPIG